MSASDGDDDEVRMKNVRMRERSKGHVQVVAIGGESVRVWNGSFQSFLYISEVCFKKKIYQ